MLGRLARRPNSCSSPTGRLWKAQIRFTSTHVHIPNDLGPTSEDAHGTYRVRSDQKEKDLPLPPLLDPVVLERRSRWENNKARPNAENFTPFQKKLQANPYAHALASPVRQCRATLILLPELLLTTLHARPHPTTNDPWLLPVSLTTNKRHLGPPYRFLGHVTVARSLGKKKLWERGLYARMEQKLGAADIKKMVWREDLPDLILDLMQKQLIKKLSWNFAWRGRLIPVGSPASDDIIHVDGASCVLIFRSLRTRADDIEDRAKALMAEMDKWSLYVAQNFADLDPHNSPNVTHRSPAWYVEPLVPRFRPRTQFPEFDFKSTVWRGRKIALYSLTDLLGEEKAQELLKDSEYTGDKCVVLKEAKHNMPVEILLMRLQAYVARPGV